MSEASPDEPLAVQDILFAVLDEWLLREEAVQRDAHAALVINGRLGIEYDPVFLHYTIKNAAENARMLRSIIGYRDTMAEITNAAVNPEL